MKQQGERCVSSPFRMRPGMRFPSGAFARSLLSVTLWLGSALSVSCCSTTLGALMEGDMLAWKDNMVKPPQLPQATWDGVKEGCAQESFPYGREAAAHFADCMVEWLGPGVYGGR